MPRYKHIDMSPRLLPVDLSAQIVPGSFEHALRQLIDHELDLCAFDTRYRNDSVGAPAYPPGVLLKIVLLAYSKGIVSSRSIEAACRQNVVFMAISGDTQPHFTTIAQFVSGFGPAIEKTFAQVLLVCDRAGLIGRELFAIDGVKLPSNASKARSGTRADFQHQAAKMETAVRQMISRHRESDRAADPLQQQAARDARKLERLTQEAAQLREWLQANPQDRRGGQRNQVRQSNRTDNESAKMATSKGVIQGYTGVAAVDAKHQIIVEAQAHGVGQEQELLVPVVAALKEQLRPDSEVVTDAGYHSKANVAHLEQQGIKATVPDNNYRKRDVRFEEQGRHKDKPDPLYDKSSKEDKPKLFGPKDFTPAEDYSHCICPAGKRLYRNGHHHDLNGLEAVKFTGAQRDCLNCTLRDKCLRTPQRTKVRQVAIFTGKTPDKPETPAQRMQRHVDSELGRERIGERFAIVEPVFGNLRYNKGLDRFTLRGRKKVDAQWKLYCLVHNIEKLANSGYAR
jgi:transposase